MILKSVGIGVLALSTFVGSSSSSEAGIFDRLCRKGRSTPQCATLCISTSSVCAAPAPCAYEVSGGCGLSIPMAVAAPQAADIQIDLDGKPGGAKLNLKVPQNSPGGPVSGYLSN